MGLARYPCTFENCYQAYNRTVDLRKHLNSHNGIVTTFKCNIENCDKVYRSHGPLNEHKRKVHKCGKEYKQKKRSIPKPCVCEICGKFLSTSTALKNHRLAHLGKSHWPYACDEEGCTRRFLKASLLATHKKRHAGIKEYACPHCSMRKTTRHELNIHINFHTFERKYPCHICNKVYKSSGDLGTHIRKVHEGRGKTTNKTNQNIFQCRFCGHNSSSAFNLRNHERTHTGEKPHICKECGKAFTSYSGLYCHKQKHAEGENPHACEECGKRFKWSSSLLSHKKVHVLQVPYKCEECGKEFRWPGNYYSHKKKHFNLTVKSDADVAEDEVPVVD